MTTSDETHAPVGAFADGASFTDGGDVAGDPPAHTKTDDNEKDED